MRADLLLIALLPLAVASSVAGQSPSAPDELATARQEQASAEAQLAKLEKAAAAAKGKAQKLSSERQAAAAAIELSEARITAAEIRLGRESARLAALKRSLALSQRPVSALLAGLAMMGERPPILALADRGGVDELVRTRILLNSTLPVVRQRTAALAGRIEAIERQERSAGRARAALIADRHLLEQRQKRLAGLEESAFAASIAAGGAALEAGDRVMAGREALEIDGSSAGFAMARELLGEDRPPPRPGKASDGPAAAPFAYMLPADSPVLRGLAEVDRGGVRSRGLTMATPRGLMLKVPADGVLRFAGPYENYDGIAVIDHGRGWVSLIVNVAVQDKAGARLGGGDPLGRALGPVDVELSHDGKRVSPAIIAGSSERLFKQR